MATTCSVPFARSFAPYSSVKQRKHAGLWMSEKDLYHLFRPVPGTGAVDLYPPGVLCRQGTVQVDRGKSQVIVGNRSSRPHRDGGTKLIRRPSPVQLAALRQSLHADVDVILNAWPVARLDAVARGFASNVSYSDTPRSASPSADGAVLAAALAHDEAYDASEWLKDYDAVVKSLQKTADIARRRRYLPVISKVPKKEILCTLCHEAITEESLPKNPAMRELDGQPYHARRGCYWAEYRRRRVAAS